ncbi:class I SAM-dependent methyltransferase [Shewanella psychropiezotolerans]|uniref:Class I SAM-dependent methyltransferase n=1 Tax=Shewanella psychropiezotolerans TaxID=2593655 RepID=A0ABX5X0K7_9GAMM|nr:MULTISPECIES: class I SAM-dependent methyltransferase [Shewanella]MPY24615.1 class I SAM-dependent methyltransferase [Shewanella sp. YLB-07]QDO83962.1 class I SAM-dependent methyltransferase [Shewanella psychropiezotolerans]
MEKKAYAELAENQDNHWWFKGRREIIEFFLRRYSVNREANAKVLEVGCGTGGNLAMLSQFGDVTAVEMDEFSRAYVKEKLNIEVHYGALPFEIDLQDKQFDLICLFDVLEHIEDDISSLERVSNLLKDKGYLIITVPAYQYLYGKHDKEMHHYRRYNSAHLSSMLSDCGFSIVSMSYFNSFLLPIAGLSRLLDKFTVNDSAIGAKQPATVINQFLYRILSFEKHVLKFTLLPFGLSLICIVQKK